MGKFAAFSERPKAKSVSASGAFALLFPWPGAVPLDPARDFAPDPHYKDLTLVFGALQLSSTGTVFHIPLGRSRSYCHRVRRTRQEIIISDDMRLAAMPRRQQVYWNIPQMSCRRRLEALATGRQTNWIFIRRYVRPLCIYREQEN